MVVKVNLIENGKLPQIKHSGDACYDCYAREAVVIPNMQSRTIKLGFAMQIPDGWEIQIRPRSGLSSKGITAEWGTGDSCYRGEYATTLFNHSGADFAVNEGDRICQMAIRQIPGKNTECMNVLEKMRISHGWGKAVNSLVKAVSLLADTSIAFRVVDKLEESERGEKGFGSSGVRD